MSEQTAPLGRGDAPRSGLPPTAGPQWVGGYYLLRRLGTGGSGTVWEARDEAGNLVALKLLHPSVADSATARARLLRETRLVNQISGPGIARVLDVETEDVQPFVVTELVAGPTLSELTKTEPLTIEECAYLGVQLADLLRRVHARGVVHRDLKASNVIIGADGPVLIDFGLAQTESDDRLTQTGQIAGTPGYVSPELLTSSRHPTFDLWQAGDWWALAALLLSSLTGEPPFGPSGPQGAFRVMEGKPATADLPAELQSLFRRALAVDPSRRLPVDELLAALEDLASGGGAGPGPVGAVPGDGQAAPGVAYALPREEAPTEAAGAPATGQFAGADPSATQVLPGDRAGLVDSGGGIAATSLLPAAVPPGGRGAAGHDPAEGATVVSEALGAAPAGFGYGQETLVSTPAFPAGDSRAAAPFRQSIMRQPVATDPVPPPPPPFAAPGGYRSPAPVAAASYPPGPGHPNAQPYPTPQPYPYPAPVAPPGMRWDTPLPHYPLAQLVFCGVLALGGVLWGPQGMLPALAALLLAGAAGAARSRRLLYGASSVLGFVRGLSGAALRLIPAALLGGGAAAAVFAGGYTHLGGYLGTDQRTWQVAFLDWVALGPAAGLPSLTVWVPLALGMLAALMAPGAGPMRLGLRVAIRKALPHFGVRLAVTGGLALATAAYLLVGGR